MLRDTAPVNPDTPVAIATKKPRTAITIAAIGGAAVVIAATIVAFALTRGGTPTPAPATEATPVVNGIARPDKTCVTTDGTDHKEYWDGNGWWAGRVDGEPKEMPANAVLLLKINGHQINSAWICAPRSNG